jgi:chorismate mutase/prephenate dehydratase
MRDLGEIRQEIDQIDEQIVQLYEERMRLASEVAEYKIGTGKPVFDKEREESKLAVLTEKASGSFTRHGIRELFEQIMTMSRKKQYKLLLPRAHRFPGA